MDSEEKSLYGLVGYPVSHSLSPLMHNAAFEALKLNCEYRLFPLKEEELEAFFIDLKKKDSPIFGLNVTIPYKEKIIPFLDTASPYVEKTMAVNTICIHPKKRTLHGHNTDGPGFLTHLAELKFDTDAKRIAILGAGGAARAIISVLALLPERPQWIRIFDVDRDKALTLVDDLGGRMDISPVKVVESIDDLNIELADLLINATPIGMKEADQCLIEEELFHHDMLVYDLIYNPAETKLLKLAKSKGARTSNGLGMLFYQGVLAFQHWANAELDESKKTIMRASLMKGLHR
jgi:shikimate dehydrogenase